MRLVRLLFPWVCALAAASCKQVTPGDPCAHVSANVPAFDIHIVSSVGRSLSKMTITVDSGGYVDVHDLPSTCDPTSSLVCFATTRGDLCTVEGGGDVPDAGSELTCDLWVDGNADLTIEAEGHAKTTVRLELEQDSCKNTKTKSVRVELTQPE